MISIKEYAESRNKTIQAVHQQRKRKKYVERLKNHVYEQGGVIWLDDEAIKILDESSDSSISLVDQTAKEKIQQLELKLVEAEKREKDLMNQLNGTLIKLNNQTEQMTLLLLENKEKTLILEQKQNQEQQIKELQNALEQERNKGFFARLFGR